MREKGEDMKSSDFTILFAEDNLEIQKVYEKNFVREGYHVLLAEHGLRVMAELREQKVDLLITDLEMPGMNTLELLSFLKRDYPKLPVIIVSGHYADLQEDFLAKGFKITAFFNKPISVAILKEKVREILKVDQIQGK